MTTRRPDYCHTSDPRGNPVAVTVMDDDGEQIAFVVYGLMLYDVAYICQRAANFGGAVSELTQPRQQSNTERVPASMAPPPGR